MQRNENHFFCVDENGEIFEDTRVEANERPISQELCLNYPFSCEYNRFGDDNSLASVCFDQASRSS